MENNTESKNVLDNKPSKKRFFKKVWYSVTNIEKYPEMAAEGVGRTIGYLSKIIAILAIVMCIGMVIQTHNTIKETANYIEKEFPEISYKNGKLELDQEEPMILEDSIQFGKIIIDTNELEQEKVNEYINDLNGDGILVLQDKLIIRNTGTTGEVVYNYEQTLGQVGITEFNKQDLLNYVNSTKIVTLYIAIFITLFIYVFINYLINALWYSVIVSILGYITSLLIRIKMRYVAIYNMAVYSLTLSTILNMIYIAINTFVDFKITYFQVMYTSVATIYLVAAIFIIKSEFIKKQAELMKVVEVQKVVKKEIDEEKEKEEKKQNKETGKEENEENKEEEPKKRKRKKGDDLGEAPEGSNA